MMRIRAISISIAVVSLTLALVLTVSGASPGTLEPPGPPGSTYSYTLEDIYQRLDIGEAGSPSAFTEASSGPTLGTGHTLNEIMAKAPQTDAANGATQADVLAGKTFWGLTSGEWGVATGTRHGGCTCAGTLNGTRWCDNGDGTVTDLTTCLTWLKKADWGGAAPLWATTVTGMNAHDRCAQLWDGSPWEGSAGLSDGSVQGDWRLPTKTELEWLANGPECVRDITPRSFTGVPMSSYWSSMFAPEYPSNAWIVALYSGAGRWSYKTNSWWVWPVRGGQ